MTLQKCSPQMLLFLLLSNHLNVRSILFYFQPIEKKYAGVFAGAVVHRDHQIPHGIWHPAMGGSVLVNHDARQRHAFAFDPVFAPDFASFGHARTLKHALEPAAAACARKLSLVPPVKVSHVPTRKAAFVQLHNVIDLGPTVTSFGIWLNRLSSRPSSPSALKRSIRRRKLRSHCPSNRAVSAWVNRLSLRPS